MMTVHSTRNLAGLICALAALPGLAAVVEFYNPDLNNYFITADPTEQAFVDSGAVGRWQRTGNTFATGGPNQVCRFYGNSLINPATGTIYGPNSHFYTADPAECAGLKAMYTPNAKSWKFESNDFLTTPAVSGACASGLVAVYRAYNNGFAKGIDSNHRITSNHAVYLQNVAAGWSGEGVVMCAPPGGATASCTFTLNSPGTQFAASGGNGSVTITAGPGCAWAATSGDGWIAISGAASGGGNGTVGYTVAAYTGASSRNGTLIIAGQSVAITQSGATTGPGGQFVEYTVPTANAHPVLVSAGVDESMWFVETNANKLGKITSDGTITEYAMNSSISGALPGADGNMWFALPGENKIGKISSSGVIVEYPLPTPNSSPGQPHAGPDGNMWFTETITGGDKIGRITPNGVVTEFPVPTVSLSLLGMFPAGDGNLWFSELIQSNQSVASKAGRITPSGVITEFALPAPVPFIFPGPDGNLWFAELSPHNSVGRITTAGIAAEFAIPTANAGASTPFPGPDGNLWFTELTSNKIGKLTPGGVISEYQVPAPNTGLTGVASGPDGNLWFASGNGNSMCRITPAGVISVYALTTSNAGPTAPLSGKDGNLWFAEQNANKIVKFVLP